MHARQNVAARDMSHANAIRIRNVTVTECRPQPAGFFSALCSALLSLFLPLSSFQKSPSRGTVTFHADCFCRASERCTRRESLRSMIVRETAATAVAATTVASSKVATAANFTRNSHSRRPDARRRAACLSAGNYVFE